MQMIPARTFRSWRTRALRLAGAVAFATMACGGFAVASAGVPSLPTGGGTSGPVPAQAPSVTPSGLQTGSSSPVPQTTLGGLPTTSPLPLADEESPVPDGGGQPLCGTCSAAPGGGGGGTPATNGCTSTCTGSSPAVTTTNKTSNSGDHRGSGRASGHGGSPAAGEPTDAPHSSVATIATRAAQLAGPLALPLGLAAVAIAAVLFTMRGPGELSKIDEGAGSHGPSRYRL